MYILKQNPQELQKIRWKYRFCVKALLAIIWTCSGLLSDLKKIGIIWFYRINTHLQDVKVNRTESETKQIFDTWSVFWRRFLFYCTKLYPGENSFCHIKLLFFNESNLFHMLHQEKTTSAKHVIIQMSKMYNVKQISKVLVYTFA